MTQIVFPILPSQISPSHSLDDFYDESWGEFVLFTFSQITKLELMAFDELKSDLSKCFSEINVSVTASNLTLTTMPTGLCRL